LGNWRSHRDGRENVDVRSEQGYEIGRPSLLLLTAEQRGGNIDTFVGGKSMIVAQGEFIQSWSR
jgi:trans-2,3-dihydro-3-hydroxyanthranilate isomerase